jgi:hypothetical protein
MRHKANRLARAGGVGAAVLAVLAIGCGSEPEQAGFDVQQCLGMDEELIAAVIGNPSDTAGSVGSEKRLMYRQPPQALEALELVISDGGVCIQVTGTTSDGFATPEALLNAIGLGELERRRAGRDPLGMNYEIAGVGAVQVHRPSNTVSEYRNFTVTAE